MSLTTRQPLYLIGGFGGAARAVCDHVLGRSRPEFTDTWQEKTVPDLTATFSCQASDSVPLAPMSKIGTDIAAFAGSDLETVMNNGLDDAQNRELMTCTDARETAALVLQGLGKLQEESAGMS